MKQFRPHHFPPLHQFGVARPAGDQDAEAADQWQSALADGYRQGQREGYEAGFGQGRAYGLPRGEADGHAAALARFDALARPVEAMLAGLAQLASDLRTAQRNEVVDLVGKVARQVIRAELALQPVQLLALVEEALAAMPPSRGEVEVFMNPEELRRVRELDPRRARSWTLLPDPALAPGECRVRAGDHEVDAGCQGRLAAVMEQVHAQLPAEDAAP